MKVSIFRFPFMVSMLLFVAVMSIFAQASGTPASGNSGQGSGRSNNIITGFIFEATNRTPVADVYVELINDVYTTIRRIKTDASGRYIFSGMAHGLYQVKVVPVGTNYMEDTQEVQIVNNDIGAMTTSDSVYLDIYLKLDKRKANLAELNPSAVVFAQNVPAEAQNLYKKGLIQLGKTKEQQQGLENIKKSLEIFPDYYDALYRMSLEHVRKQQYYEAIPYLVKAVTVNQRSFAGLYLLGVTAYNLRQLKEAAEAFRLATVINPQSISAFTQYGMILRIDGRFKEAEEALLKAQSLAKESPSSEVSWQLALLYDKTKRYEQAANELESYLKLRPDVENAKQVKSLIAEMRTKAKK